MVNLKDGCTKKMRLHLYCPKVKLLPSFLKVKEKGKKISKKDMGEMTPCGIFYMAVWLAMLNSKIALPKI